MRPVASGRAKILVIELLDLRILVRFADRLRFIVAVQHACTYAAHIRKVADIAGHLRLAAAVHASARTSHDLDEMIIRLACLHLVKQLPRIANCRKLP